MKQENSFLNNGTQGAGENQNKGVSSLSVMQHKVDEFCKAFDDEIETYITAQLRASMVVYDENKEVYDQRVRDILLLGNLTAFSMMFPTTRLPYGTNRYSLNLCSLIGAPAASNKGVLKYSIKLLNAVNDFLYNEYRDDLNAHRKASVEWEREKKLAAKEKRDINYDMEPGDEPKVVRLVVPANTSKSMIMDMLKASERNGSIIASTEIDTFVDANSKDYGNMADVINKAVMNETVDKAFRVDGDTVRIEYPMLGLLLSGTYDQLHRMVTSYVNGLGSRLPIYLSSGERRFTSQEPHHVQRDYSKMYNDMGREALSMWDFFRRFYFSVVFTKEQWDMHTKTWREIFNDVVLTREEMTSVSLRFGILHMRIAAVLTMLRLWEEVKTQQETYRSIYVMVNDNMVTCVDDDFRMAQLIATTLFEHTMLFSTTKNHDIQDIREMKQWRWQYEVLKAMPETFSTEDFIAVASKEPYNMKTSICYRKLREMSKGKQRRIRPDKDKKVDNRKVYVKVAR